MKEVKSVKGKINIQYQIMRTEHNNIVERDNDEIIGLPFNNNIQKDLV